MMWIFIVTDELLFSGCFCGYGFLRMASSLPWPNRTEVFSIPFIALMTFILITSSMFMATAVMASSRRPQEGALEPDLHDRGRRGLPGLPGGGVVALLPRRRAADHQPVGAPQFGASFFVLTASTARTCFSGLVILVITADLAPPRARRRRRASRWAGLYWHFVDLVSVFIFTLFYLVRLWRTRPHERSARRKPVPGTTGSPG